MKKLFTIILVVCLSGCGVLMGAITLPFKALETTGSTEKEPSEEGAKEPEGKDGVCPLPD